MIEHDNRRKRIGRLILLLLFFGITIYGWRTYATQKQTPVLSPIPEPNKPKQQPVFPLFQKKKNPDDLADKVNSAIDGVLNDYSVYVESLDSDFVMGLSETETFTAASVNKVPILATLYYQNQNGAIDMDRIITLQQEEIQDYGTGSMRYDPPGTTYSIKTLARLMIKQSDNTAAFILANEIIGVDTIQSLINLWGLSQTNIINNKTSNKDMAMLFRKLYEEKIVDHARTQEMLSFLKDTDFETRLPANLPDGVTVYHKIGSDTGEIHDVGIITNGKLTYYIGIFTNDETDDAGTEQLISKVSKIVYDYML